MRNSVKLALIVIIAVLVLCGCSADLGTMDNYLGGSITRAIDDDTYGLETLKNVSFDKEIQSCFSEQIDANKAMKDSLLAQELNANTKKVTITTGNDSYDIKFDKTLHVDYRSMACQVAAMIVKMAASKAMENPYRMLATNSDGHLDMLLNEAEDHEELVKSYTDGNKDRVELSTEYAGYSNSYLITNFEVETISIFSITSPSANAFDFKAGKTVSVKKHGLYKMYGLYWGKKTLTGTISEVNKWADIIDDANNTFDEIPEELTKLTGGPTAKGETSEYSKFQIKVEPGTDVKNETEGGKYTVTISYFPGRYNGSMREEIVVFKADITIKKDKFPDAIKSMIGDSVNIKAINTFGTNSKNAITNAIKAMATGEIYVLKDNADISVVSGMNTEITDNIRKQFKDSGYKKELAVDKFNNGVLNDKEALKEIDIPIKINEGIKIGVIKKTSIVNDYVKDIVGIESNEMTPMFKYERVNGKGKLYLLKYPVARVEKIRLGSGDKYNMKVKDSAMWTNVLYAGIGALYNNYSSKDYMLRRSEYIYLYDDKSIAWMTNYSIEYDVTNLVKFSDKFSIIHADAQNAKPSKYKSHFLLMSYLEGLYLPGTYPKGVQATASNVENVLALGRRIQLDKHAIENNEFAYNDKIGDIYSAVNGQHVAIHDTDIVKTSDLISAEPGGKSKVKQVIAGVDAELKIITVAFGRKNDKKLPVSIPAAEDIYVQSGKNFIKIGDYVDTLQGNNDMYTLPISYEISKDGGMDIYFGYVDKTRTADTYEALKYDSSDGTYKVDFGTNGSQYNQVIGFSPQNIKVDVVCAGSSIWYEPVSVTTDSKRNMCKISIKKRSNANIEPCKMKIIVRKNKTNKSSNAPTEFSLTFNYEYEKSAYSKTSSDGGPVMLADKWTNVGKTGRPFEHTTYNILYASEIDVCPLKFPGDGTTSGILAHEETPSSSSNLPRLFVMGAQFDVHSTDFAKWMNEEQEVDPDGDGNLRKWIAVLQGYGYKNYPCEADNVTAILDQIADIMSRVYNFGDIEEKDSTIILDTAVLAKVQEDIDNNILINEAKIIRAVTKILGILMSFIGFLWLVAWLVDAGTTGDGNGALYFVTFKHMRTGAGMSKKEAVEMSTEGYKYVTAAGIAKRVFILMALGVTLIIVDPINLVSTVISWVDGAYRLIRENIFNVRDNIG